MGEWKEAKLDPDEEAKRKKAELTAQRKKEAARKATEAYQKKKMDEWEHHTKIMVGAAEERLNKKWENSIKSIEERIQEDYKKPLSTWLESLNETSSDESEDELPMAEPPKAKTPVKPETTPKPTEAEVRRKKFARFF
jgi:hypothetical protein